MIQPALILASTSVYRKELLSRLQLDFKAYKPTVDEELIKAEILGSGATDPVDLAQKLAIAKGMSLATEENCVIGGDQICLFNGQILGKSGSFEKALEQLEAMVGQKHELITAICVIAQTKPYFHIDRTKLTMKNLNREQLTHYLKKDEPYDCAGSYKIEKLGITLFEKVESKDFTAIQGLPLMALTKILNQVGYQIP